MTNEREYTGANIRVVLVDDHESVREWLRSLLAQEPDMVVVAEARDGRTAVEIAINLRPDVVVMDVAMPELNGIEATRQISAEAPEVKVIALSAHAENQLTVGMIQAGASAYLLKKSAIDELVNAIREVAAGRNGNLQKGRSTLVRPETGQIEDASDQT